MLWYLYFITYSEYINIMLKCSSHCPKLILVDHCFVVLLKQWKSWYIDPKSVLHLFFCFFLGSNVPILIQPSSTINTSESMHFAASKSTYNTQKWATCLVPVITEWVLLIDSKAPDVVCWRQGITAPGLNSATAPYPDSDPLESSGGLPKDKEASANLICVSIGVYVCLFVYNYALISK